MCGIAGLLITERRTGEAARAIEQMCAALHHRGPDEGGTFVRGGAAIGMRRLSIVDIANGHQPMIGRAGEIALVFNGEIYNAPEIRAELESEGIALDTRSDTEVILRLYERDPDAIEAKLRGMWAFAILDVRRRRLLLSRDRFGIKPLFVAQRGRELAFASELRALHPLRAIPAFEAALVPDRTAAHAMLSWGFVPNERTIFSGVERIPPATRVSIDLDDGTRTTQRFWECHPRSDAARVKSIDEARECLRPVLRETVAQHLRSDVPCATFLSGGIDSSLISGLTSDLAPYPVEAFCVGFDDPRYDESPYAQQVADRLGIKLSKVVLTASSAPPLALEALRAYDEPFGDSSAIATFALSRLCVKTHKVALGGDGGDEAFAGYRKHRMVHVRDLLGPFPRTREAMARVIAMLPRRADRSSRVADLVRKALRVSRSLSGDDATAYRALTQVAGLEATADLVPGAIGAELLERELEASFRAQSGSQLDRTLRTDLVNTLPNDLLTKVDRASMACSLEVRVPFLDHEVFELALGLPRKFTLGRRGKETLRAEAEARFGTSIARRPKHGFEVPVESWLRGPLAATCEAVFAKSSLDKHGLLSSAALSEGRFREVLRARPQLVWHAFALAVWCEDNLVASPTRVTTESIAVR